MILGKILGGLGNQMFCYAAGRATALRHNVEFKLDTSNYPDDDGRSFELKRFLIHADVATATEIASYHKYDSRRLSNKILCRLLFRSYGQTRNFRQRGFAFDQEFLKIGSHCRLDGLFQSERFFESAALEIRKDLRLKQNEIDPFNKELSNRMRSCESVSLHVRRSDYVSNTHYSKIIEPCSLEYYKSAIAILTERIHYQQIFVFSDDPDWCRKHLALPKSTTIIDHNGSDKPWLDMHLMASCKHHITANSTFSWWGAWLAEWEGQIVISPKQWYRSDSKLNDNDIIPSRWITI